MKNPSDEIDEYEYCCEGTGHGESCESREPAHDLADLICRAPCLGCCPNGHHPSGIQADQDRTAVKARSMLNGFTRR